jgi:hypothetical protein
MAEPVALAEVMAELVAAGTNELARRHAAVLDRHTPRKRASGGRGRVGPRCPECGGPAPCTTVRLLRGEAVDG